MQTHDELMKNLTRAAQFMSAARETQRESHKVLVGPEKVADALKEENAITIACSKMIEGIGAESGIGEEALSYLSTKFEELCRRRKFDIPQELHEYITRLLTAELYINADRLAAEPEKLIPATIYNGVLDFINADEFAEFRDMPGIFQRVAIGNPSDPAGALRRMIAGELPFPDSYKKYGRDPAFAQRVADGRRPSGSGLPDF